MIPSARRLWTDQRPGRHHVVDTACVAPWVSIEFDPSGWVTACCTGHIYPLGRIGRHRLQDLWGGPRAQVLRESLASWDLSVACGPCRWHLEHGRPDPVAAVYDQFDLTDPEPVGPQVMVFALSNRCNLACVMCNGELSSTIRQAAGLPPITSPYDDQFFTDLEPLLDGIRVAKFLGGEPFLVREHHRVWQMLGELEQRPRLHITTNGTIWTDRVERLLDEFDVEISISIDASTPETYAHVRAGGDLEQVHRNIGRFVAAGAELHVSYCLMSNNWHELHDFLGWAAQFRSRASVNVVTDLGLALHDLDLDDLLTVRAKWEDQRGRNETVLGHNQAVFDVQIDQLDAVIIERRNGIRPTPRQALPVDADFLAPPIITEEVPDDTRTVSAAEHTERLRRWSGGGEVAVLHGRDDRIIDIVQSHARLGIDTKAVGRPVAELISIMEATDGRSAWAIDSSGTPHVMTRTFTLTAERPVRGVGGSIVRTVHLGRPDGWTLLVAEDLMYDEPEDAGAPPIGGVPVHLTPGRQPRSNR